MLNIIEILDSQRLKLPHHNKFDGDFIRILSDLCDNMIATLEANESTLFRDIIPIGATAISVDPKQLIAKFKVVSNEVKGIIEKYIKENPSSAYLALDKLMKDHDVGTFFNNSYVSTISKGHKFFRARNIEPRPNRINGDEMFHIPFQFRHLVSTQRYSIPGKPCLYLGESIEVCCLEVQVKTIRHLKVIGYHNKNELKLRNMVPFDTRKFVSSINDPALYISVKYKLLDELVRYIKAWPLFAACYIKLTYPHEPKFKFDYIIPQLILLWFDSNFYANYNGLKYLSVWSSGAYSEKNINYVLPVRTFSYQGFCTTLTSAFEPTRVLDVYADLNVERLDNNSFTEIETALFDPIKYPANEINLKHRFNHALHNMEKIAIAIKDIRKALTELIGAFFR